MVKAASSPQTFPPAVQILHCITLTCTIKLSKANTQECTTLLYSFPHHTELAIDTYLTWKACIRFLPSRVAPGGYQLLLSCFMRRACPYRTRVMPSSGIHPLTPTLWLILDACGGACDSSCRAFLLFLRNPLPWFLPLVHGFRSTLT